MRRGPNQRRLALRTWIALAFLAACTDCTSVWADMGQKEVPQALAFHHVANATLGEPFLRQAETARASIPACVLRGIQQSGWRVKLAEFVVDAAPFLKDVHPRGWPADFSWQHTDSVLLPRARLLVLAEKRVRRNGEVVSSDRVAGVLRHELGHAFDMALGGLSQLRSSSPAFVEVYRQDIARFSPERREMLSYYLQAQPAGRQEAFAEAFAVVLGGGSDVTKHQQFAQAFPAVIEFVQREIDGYAFCVSGNTEK